MTQRHAIWDLLDRLQMDNRAQAAKLVELRAHVASMDLPDTHGQWQPALGQKDPVKAIHKLIANGVIRDHVDLTAELAGAGLDGTDAAWLKAELDARLTPADIGRSSADSATKGEAA